MSYLRVTCCSLLKIQVCIHRNRSNIECFMSCRWGDVFDRNTHASGTEIKAITYSAMQIYEESNKSDVYVIVDI